MSKKKKPIYKSAVSGLFITKKYAVAHPKITVKEMVTVKKTKKR